MLQALLAERFKLVIHREVKETTIYVLVVGRGGPKLRKSDLEEKDCPMQPMTPIANVNETVTCHQFHGGRGRGVHGRAVDISDLAAYMEVWTDRPLVCQGRSKTRPLGRRESRPLPRQLRVCIEGFAGAAGA
jgi:uncharacterized protein (TIGR03435 family)